MIHVVFCSWKYYLLLLRRHGLERHIWKNKYSNTRLCAVWTTDSAPHYNVSNSTCLKLLLKRKRLHLNFSNTILIFFYVDYNIVHVYFMWNSNTIELLRMWHISFFQLPYYIYTRKLIFSSTKIFLDLVKGKSFADLVCASLKPTQYITMSNFTDNNFLFPLYACIFTQTNISWTKLGNGATWRALVNVNRSDATPTVFQIKYFPLTPVH